MAVRSLKNSTLENFANYSSSMNAGYSFQDYELIESVFVAATTASVTFSNLNQYATEYRHLQIRLVARGSGATTEVRDMLIRFNADTGANYSGHNLRGNGSVVSSNAITSATSILNESTFVGNSNTANIFGSAVIDILDPFSTTKNTTTRSLGGHNSSTARLYLGSGAFYSTAAITSIDIRPGAESILAGSRFSLYGIR